VRAFTLASVLVAGIVPGTVTRSADTASPVCLRAAFPEQLSLLAGQYLAGTIILQPRDELAPIISDTTKMPGHPRRQLTVLRPGAPPPDYAAWWPTATDSIALYWRFGVGRGVYVAAAADRWGDLHGRLFLTIGARREGPLVFTAKRVACFVGRLTSALALVFAWAGVRSWVRGGRAGGPAA
jgi:hypothetical protein